MGIGTFLSKLRMAQGRYRIELKAWQDSVSLQSRRGRADSYQTVLAKKVVLESGIYIEALGDNSHTIDFVKNYNAAHKSGDELLDIAVKMLQAWEEFVEHKP